MISRRRLLKRSGAAACALMGTRAPGFAFTTGNGQNDTGQIAIPRVEQMPNIPQPFRLRELNAANNARLFYSGELPDHYQTIPELRSISRNMLGYEACSGKCATSRVMGERVAESKKGRSLCRGPRSVGIVVACDRQALCLSESFEFQCFTALHRRAFLEESSHGPTTRRSSGSIV